MSRLLVVVGPTATGKSALAVQAAERAHGEVVSADSMQVYRGFDIGTGKPTIAERRGIPHHLIDVVDPDQTFSAARFVELADRAIDEIERRDRAVIVAGGTGLYVRALLHGLFDAPASDPEIRREHERVRDEQGLVELRRRLCEVDPEAAARILEGDFVRTSRALEVYEQTGVPISQLHARHGFAARRHDALTIALGPPREQLRANIEARVDAMVAAGWVDEVRQLIAAGHRATHPMGALGYRHLRAHLAGMLDLEEAVRQTKRDTWRFAKRQLNWFRSEPGVLWYEQPSDVPLERLEER